MITEPHVQGPTEYVLDRPVSSNQAAELLGSPPQAGDVVVGSGRDLVADRPALAASLFLLTAFSVSHVVALGPYVVELDGRRIETSAMLVAVANTPSFGGGMRVCPDADPTDGLFDVLVVRALSVPGFLRVFPKVYRGAHVTHEAVEIHRATRVRLDAQHIPSQADGEPFPGLVIREIDGTS